MNKIFKALCLGGLIFFIVKLIKGFDKQKDLLQNLSDTLMNTFTGVASRVNSKAFLELKLRGFANATLLSSFIVSQTKHETANYTSNAFVNGNNVAGYKEYKGSLLQIGVVGTALEGGRYAKYKTVEDSVLELVQWINRRRASFINVKTIEDFATALKANSYFHDGYENYLRGLKYWLSH